MAGPADQLYERLLVLRCQTGEEAAFEELVSRYSPRIRYYLRKMLGDRTRADDAAQEVWIDVFRNLRRLKDAGAFAAWIYRIARDRAFRELRRAHRVVTALDELEGIEDIGDEVVSAEDAEAVHLALDTLAPEHREVLVLRFLEDMSYEAIADVTGSPLGTVRSRIYYAKRSLREALERTSIHGGSRPGQGAP